MLLGTFSCELWLFHHHVAVEKKKRQILWKLSSKLPRVSCMQNMTEQLQKTTWIQSQSPCTSLLGFGVFCVFRLWVFSNCYIWRRLWYCGFLHLITWKQWEKRVLLSLNEACEIWPFVKWKIILNSVLGWTLKIRALSFMSYSKIWQRHRRIPCWKEHRGSSGPTCLKKSPT